MTEAERIVAALRDLPFTLRSSIGNAAADCIERLAARDALLTAECRAWRAHYNRPTPSGYETMLVVDAAVEATDAAGILKETP